MEDVFVGSLMSSPVHSVDSDATLREAGRVLLDHDIGSVVVVDDGDLRGILTATDFVRTVAGENDWEPTTNVAEVMSREVLTTTADTPISVAADLMLDTGHGHVPVVDEGSVIGMLTTVDLTAYVSTSRPPYPPQG